MLARPLVARGAAVLVSAVIAATATGVTGATPAWADAPSVSGYTPANVVPGTTLHIVGSGLAATTDVAFTGGVHAAPSTAPTDTDVTVTVPAGAQSGPLTLTPATGTTPPDLGVEVTSISRDAGALVYPAATYVRATLTAGGHGIAGQTATLLVRAVGITSWSPAPGPQTTNANGAVAFLVKPTRTTDYAVRFAGSTTAAAVQTTATRVASRPTLSISFPVVVPILTVQHLTGAVHPATAGKVLLQRYLSGAWHLAGTATADRYGRFAFPVEWKTKGVYVYRVLRPADAQHLAVSTSAKSIRAVDRTLRSGMTGPDVSYLQQRLQALHYDVPAVTGVFNYDTLHAVIAFEKVQRITRDGVVSPTVWVALGRPIVPRLLHPLAGVGAVEIDLTRQVLFYAVNGAIVRILDVSTGGGYTFVDSSGNLAKAITPQGHFSIRYKINKWVTSKLGTLYRPAYFNDSGYAIHGEGEVPSYPASHGCVRITVPAMDRMYSKLTIGMSVWIYHT